MKKLAHKVDSLRNMNVVREDEQLADLAAEAVMLAEEVFAE